jgi:hypothetical protein
MYLLTNKTTVGDKFLLKVKKKSIETQWKCKKEKSTGSLPKSKEAVEDQKEGLQHNRQTFCDI